MPYEIESAFDWSKLDNHRRYDEDGTEREPWWNTSSFVTKRGRLAYRQFKTEAEARDKIMRDHWMYKRYIMWRVVRVGTRNKVEFRDVVGDIIHNWHLKDQFGAVLARAA